MLNGAYRLFNTLYLWFDIIFKYEARFKLIVSLLFRRAYPLLLLPVLYLLSKHLAHTSKVTLIMPFCLFNYLEILSLSSFIDIFYP